MVLKKAKMVCQYLIMIMLRPIYVKELQLKRIIINIIILLICILVLNMYTYVLRVFSGRHCIIHTQSLEKLLLQYDVAKPENTNLSIKAIKAITQELIQVVQVIFPGFLSYFILKTGFKNLLHVCREFDGQWNTWRPLFMSHDLILLLRLTASWFTC